MVSLKGGGVCTTIPEPTVVDQQTHPCGPLAGNVGNGPGPAHTKLSKKQKIGDAWSRGGMHAVGGAIDISCHLGQIPETGSSDFVFSQSSL